MSVDRHMSKSIIPNRSEAAKQLLPILPHRSDPPSPEEIFGKPRKQSGIELGLLQMQILWLLNRKSTYGYEMMDTLNKIKSTKITQGTLYPALKNLRKHNYIKGHRNEDKIVYDITSEGKKILNDTCLDFTRTFFGVFQDFVCHKCVGHDHIGDKK